MGNMNHVVGFHTISDYSFCQRRPVNRAVCTKLNIISYNNNSYLRNFQMLFTVPYESVAVASDYCSGMNYTVPSYNAPVIDANIGIKDGVVADYTFLTNTAARIYDAVLSDLSSAAYVCTGIDRSAWSYPGIFAYKRHI
jgi:hypothetical protein